MTHSINQRNPSSFHLGLQPFTTWKTFHSWTIQFDPYRPFKKKDQIVFEVRCTSQNFYPETIRFKSYSPIEYFIQVSTKSSILFSNFCIFFLYLHHFKKIWIRDSTVWPILSFFKKWSVFVKSTYGSNYVVFSNISRHFRSRYHTVLTILSFQELYISFDQILLFSTSNIS